MQGTTLLKKITILSVLSFCSLLQAFTDKATVWRGKWNAKENKYNYIITCADMHFRLDEDAEDEQIQSVKKVVQNCNEKTLFLVEDANSYSSDNEYIIKSLPTNNTYLDTNAKPCLLTGLVNYTLSMRKAAKNLECRFYSNLLDTHLFEPMNLYNGYSDEIFKLCANEILDVYTSIEKNHKLILANKSIEANALTRYQEFYVGIFNSIKEFKNQVDLIKSDEFSIKKYLGWNGKPKEELMRIFKALTDATMCMPDIIAVQSILNEQNYDKIFIFMGELHIYNIDLYLQKNGYEKVIELGNYALSKFYDNNFMFNEDKLARNMISEGITDILSFLIFLKDVKPVDPQFFINCLNEELTPDLFVKNK